MAHYSSGYSPSHGTLTMLCYYTYMWHSCSHSTTTRGFFNPKKSCSSITCLLGKRRDFRPQNTLSISLCNGSWGRNRIEHSPRQGQAAALAFEWRWQWEEAKDVECSWDPKNIQSAKETKASYSSASSHAGLPRGFRVCNEIHHLLPTVTAGGWIGCDGFRPSYLHHCCGPRFRSERASPIPYKVNGLHPVASLS